MKSASLRTRLLVWAGATTAVTIVLVIVLVDVSFRANIREQIESGLLLARQVADGARESQLTGHITDVATVALDTRLRAAAATSDPATIAQTLREVHPLSEHGWAVVADPAGVPLAVSGDAPDLGSGPAAQLLSEALDFDTADLWVSDGRLWEVAASAVLFGAEPLAVLVVGRAVDVGSATLLEATAGRPVVILYEGGAVAGEDASRIPADGIATLEGWRPTAGEELTTLELGGERFLVTAAPMPGRAGDPVGVVAVLASWDEALRPSNTLRIALIGIFVLGLLVTFAVSGMFSRTITVPVARLLRETARLRDGDLEHAIVPVRDDEIGRLAGSFEDMRVSLRAARTELIRAERLSAIGKAASAVAHDFTQPLSTIAGAVGLLRMDAGEPEVRDRCFDAIEGELDRLQRMKQEIVEFARGESSIETAVVGIDSFLENTLSALRIQLAERDIGLEVEHGYRGDWRIDSYRLERVVENLVRNAAAAISSSGTISVRTSLDGDTLVLEVEDDGPGIPAERLEEIFEPFVSFGKKEGTGLGLAITRNVVRQHGGTIEVASEGRGALFTVRLPREGAPAATRPDEARPLAKTTSSAQTP